MSDPESDIESDLRYFEHKLMYASSSRLEKQIQILKEALHFQNYIRLKIEIKECMTSINKKHCNQ